MIRYFSFLSSMYDTWSILARSSRSFWVFKNENFERISSMVFRFQNFLDYFSPVGLKLIPQKHVEIIWALVGYCPNSGSLNIGRTRVVQLDIRILYLLLLLLFTIITASLFALYVLLRADQSSFHVNMNERLALACMHRPAFPARTGFWLSSMNVGISTVLFHT